MVNHQTQLSFDEWIKFVFDHPFKEPPWYWDKSWYEFWDAWSEHFEPDRHLAYVTKLFDNASSLLIDRYSPEQIDQGLTMLLSGPKDFEIRELIWSHKLPWAVRAKCVASMVILFRDIFSQLPIEHACFMWWDELRDWDHRKDRDPHIREVIVKALEQILTLPSRDCQMSALHGLGHLPHPSRVSLIQDYLQQTSDMDEELREYVQDAMAGEVL